MRCQVYELGFLEEYNGKIVLSRHKERKTWETQGGHIEQGETPLDAAKRELYEESGAVDFEIKPLCDYCAWNEETGHGANGVVFRAVIREFGAIPDSEMAEICEFAELPENLTHPAITPVLFNHLSRKPELHRMKLKASPFSKIQNGSKTIELRLNDEKRQQVQVGDFIEFTQIDDASQRLTVRALLCITSILLRSCTLHCQRKNSAILLTKHQTPITWMHTILVTSRGSMVCLGLNCG